jgi:DNA polymerase-3 subunit alpha
LGAVRSADLPRSLSGGASSRVKLAGTVLSSKERTSAKGNKFAFVQLSDAGGTFEVMVFSELLAKSRELFASNKPLLVTADARVEGETIKLLASEVRALDDAVASTSAGLRVALADMGAIAGLKAALGKAPKGKGAIRVQIRTGADEEVDIRLKDGRAITPDLRRALGDIPGILEVAEI